MTARPVVLALALFSGRPAAAQEPNRRCQESKLPSTLPAVGALLDSARAVADLTVGDVPAAGLSFSLIYNDEDSLPQARPLDSASSASADVLAKSLRPQPPFEYWGVRVRANGGAKPALTLERSRFCPAVAAAMQARPRRIAVVLQPGDRSSALGNTIRFIADVDITETGRASNIVMLRPTFVRELDDEIVRLVRIREFHPALLDGTPVPSRMRIYGDSRRVSERLSDFGVQAEYSISMSW